MGRRLGSWLGLAAVVALAASPAAANERSTILTSEAIVEFNAGNLVAAAAQVERAVQADPLDPYAYYYRGVIRGQRKELDAAIADLRRALQLKPDLGEARLDLGVALVERGDYDEARALLEDARSDPPLQANATLYLGIARLREGATEESLRYFATAATLDPKLDVVSRYYRAVAEDRLGRVNEARANFQAVVDADPNSQIGREATQFLAVLDRRGVPAVPERRWRLFGGIGLDYDSNVSLETKNDPVPDEEEKSDVNGNLRLGGRYSLWRGEHTAVSAGYEFFQRLYVTRTDANLQGHLPSLHFTGRWEFLRFGLIGRYEFYLLKTSAYLQRAEAHPWIAFQEGDWGRSEISYRFRWSDFFDSPPGRASVPGPGAEDDQVLDSFSHEPRLRQYFFLFDPRRYLSLGYAYEWLDPTKSSGELFAYDANEVEVGAATPLVWEVSVAARYTYRRENYRNDDRLDQPHRILVLLRRPLAEWLAVSVGYYGTIHKSNRFPYNRHIVSVGLDFDF